MVSSSDKEGKRDVFKWSDEDANALCNVCLQFIADNGRKQFFKWRVIHSEVENVIGRKISNYHSCKHKYDGLRKDWSIWRKLKESATGVGWDPATGKIDAPIEWWCKKIQENKDFQKFRHKGVSAEVEDKWNRLFVDSYVRGERSHTRIPPMELALKSNGVEMKFRKRQSTPGALLTNEVPEMKECIRKLTEGSSTSGSSQPIISTVSSAMQIINRMCKNGDLTSGSDLWCFAITVLEDSTRREIFCNIQDDSSRSRWIEYLFNVKEK